MFLKVEPAGFFMYTVQIMFDPTNPDSEDDGVRNYLLDHALEPRHEWIEQIEGKDCNWMQFGGCYLGNHLQEIGKLQRTAVEEELISEEITRTLESLDDCELAINPQNLDSVRHKLAQEFHNEDNFSVNELGELEAVIDPEALKDVLRRIKLSE
tara:strand:+ start:226 stop:687 length:462 start_codon:yes stop_codon:yes gene_type:complete